MNEEIIQKIIEGIFEDLKVKRNVDVIEGSVK